MNLTPHVDLSNMLSQTNREVAWSWFVTQDTWICHQLIFSPFLPLHFWVCAPFSISVFFFFIDSIHFFYLRLHFFLLPFSVYSVKIDNFKVTRFSWICRDKTIPISTEIFSISLFGICCAECWNDKTSVINWTIYISLPVLFFSL